MSIVTNDITMSHDYSLQGTGYSLQPTAYSLQPTAYSLQPTAYSLQSNGAAIRADKHRDVHHRAVHSCTFIGMKQISPKFMDHHTKEC